MVVETSFNEETDGDESSEVSVEKEPKQDFDEPPGLAECCEV